MKNRKNTRKGKPTIMQLKRELALYKDRLVALETEMVLQRKVVKTMAVMLAVLKKKKGLFTDEEVIEYKEEYDKAKASKK